MSRVLIIDDDSTIGATLSLAIRRMGHEVEWSPSIPNSLALLASKMFEIVILDLYFPDADGLAALPEIQQVSPDSVVIVMTGHGDPDGAEIAIRNGVWDYLQKPIGIKKITLALNRAFNFQSAKRVMQEMPTSLDRSNIIGDSTVLNTCFELVKQAVAGDIDVLVSGETGTGKELFALAIHKNSSRKGNNLVVVDCAALPGTLVESILFGHEKGSYTGAARSEEGLIKQADGGTLLLDEIGELPLHVQKTFLRVLQERKFRTVGGKQEMKSDFRLIAATNRDLEKMVERGGFREDLLYRIKSMTIQLPPIRERPEDIKALALHHVTKLCDRYRVDMKGFSPDFFEVLSGYDWPGNVRELNQTLEKALAAAGPHSQIFAQHLPVEIRAQSIRNTVSISQDPWTSVQAICQSVTIPKPLPCLADFRRTSSAEIVTKYLEELMKSTNGNLKEARRIAGVSRSRLYTLLMKHGVSNGRKSSEDTENLNTGPPFH